MFGGVYEGHFNLNGDAHGEGVIKTKHAVYKATFWNDKITGICHLKEVGGDIVVGEMKDGYWDGKRTLYSEVNSYE